MRFCWALVLCALIAADQGHARKVLQAGTTTGNYPDASLADYFVQVIDGDFVLGCNKFPISGFNQWEVLEAGAGAPVLSGSQLSEGTAGGPEMLAQVMDIAVDNGFTVMRAWAHGVTERYATMPQPGEFNEEMLRGLDYALREARKRGLKVILSFTSNWTPAGGVDSFANATGLSHSDFFTDSKPKALYKDYVKTIINRQNTLTGVKYSDDPTIMAWNLINEPVCRQCAQGSIAEWVKEMAAYVKSLGTNHLLTVGEEGFYSTTQGSLSANPMYGESGWAEEWRQDFVADHQDSNIDYGSFHGWPDLWSCQDGCGALSVDFFENWIKQHEKDAASLGKPLIFEEFGKMSENREAYYTAAYNAVESSLKSGGPLKGALFWMLLAPGQTASKGEGEGSGQFGIYPGDGAFNIAKESAAKSKELSSGPASKCSKKAEVPPLPNCRDKSKGFEGPDCSLDINECVTGAAQCSKGAVCINTKGSFKCICPLGTTGDGTAGECSNDTAAVTKAMDAYWNDPKGQACDKGVDIEYPQEAAGWIEDPTGTYERDPDRKGVYGARGPVAVEQCAVACQAAEGCTVFTYNSVTKGCFLKDKQCPKNNGCQGEELICTSVDNDGNTVKVSCGTWTTYYEKQLKSASDSGACSGESSSAENGGELVAAAG